MSCDACLLGVLLFNFLPEEIAGRQRMAAAFLDVFSARFRGKGASSPFSEFAAYTRWVELVCTSVSHNAQPLARLRHVTFSSDLRCRTIDFVLGQWVRQSRYTYLFRALQVGRDLECFFLEEAAQI